MTAVALVVACSCAPTVTPMAGSEPAAWQDRVVAVATDGCGHAGDGFGTGTLLESDLVLTAAHVVIGGQGRPTVMPVDASRRWERSEPAGTRAVPGRVVGLDRRRDLALIRLSTPLTDEPLSRPDLATVDAGHRVALEGRQSGLQAAVVRKRTVIVADQVRGRDRVRRLGYLLSASTGGGDSGAGLFDTDPGSGDHRLVGMVFAASTADSGRTWAVAGSEIEELLDEFETLGPARFRCHPEQSRLVDVD